MTYKDTAVPANQVVTHTRNPSDILLDTFRRQNETEEKIPFSKKVYTIIIYNFMSSLITPIFINKIEIVYRSIKRPCIIFSFNRTLQTTMSQIVN